MQGFAFSAPSFGGASGIGVMNADGSDQRDVIDGDVDGGTYSYYAWGWTADSSSLIVTKVIDFGASTVWGTCTLSGDFSTIATDDTFEFGTAAVSPDSAFAAFADINGGLSRIVISDGSITVINDDLPNAWNSNNVFAWGPLVSPPPPPFGTVVIAAGSSTVGIVRASRRR